MNKTIESQLKRLRNLFEELHNIFEKDNLNEQEIYETENITGDFFTKSRRILDQCMYSFFEKNFSSTTKEGKIYLENKWEKVYFPINQDPERFQKYIKEHKLEQFPEFINFLNEIQPYNAGYEWMYYLQKYSNESHRKLTPNKREFIGKEFDVGGFLKFGIGNHQKPNVHISNCVFSGPQGTFAIDEFNPTIETSKEKLSEDLKNHIVIKEKFDYFIKGTNINIREICNIIIANLEEIVNLF